MKRKHLISLFTIAIIMIIGSGIFVFRSNITDYICNCEEKPVVYYKQAPALCSDNSTLSTKYTNKYVNGSKPYVLNVLSNYAELQFILKGVE